MSWLQKIHHNGSPRYVSRQNPSIGESLTLTIRIPKDAPLTSLWLRTEPDGEHCLTPLENHIQEGEFCYWRGKLTISQPINRYRFLIQSQEGMFWYNGQGITDFTPPDDRDFIILGDFQGPSWISNSVFYQIFPDTFARDKEIPLDLPPVGDRKRMQLDWENYASQETEPYTFHGFGFFGGTLPGIASKLDYLQELGITALYLNPVFQANTNHRYDVADYTQIDPLLGGNQGLIHLKKEMNKRGMRLMLDIIPNHCGYDHPWFKEAQKDPQNPEAAFFSFSHHPEHFASWLGIKALPKLDYTSQELRNRMYRHKDSPFQFWLRPPYKVDAWRLDVANMTGRLGPVQLNGEVLQEIRRAVKNTNPEVYILGENFGDAARQLQGDQLDGAMNYQGLEFPLLHWLKGYDQGSWWIRKPIESPVKWPTNAFTATLIQGLSRIPFSIALQQFNQLSSHDVPRFFHKIGRDPQLHQLALTMLFTFPGIPCVYYGEEIGLEQDQLTGSRKPMEWNPSHWDTNLLELHKKLIALRRGSKALQTGGFEILHQGEDHVIFMREVEEQPVIVALNRGEPLEVSLDLPLGKDYNWTEFFSHKPCPAKGGRLGFTLPRGGQIYLGS